MYAREPLDNMILLGSVLAQVSTEFSKVTQELFVNAEHLWMNILQGPKAEGLKRIMLEVITRYDLSRDHFHRSRRHVLDN